MSQKQHAWAAGRRSLVSLTAVVLLLSSALLMAQLPQPERAARELINGYLERWVEFYPSRAFAYGRIESAGVFENFAPERVGVWLALNAATAGDARGLLNAQDSVAGALRVDLQVLLAQTEGEQARWREDAPVSSQPQWYAEQLSQALTHLLVRDRLTAQQRSDAAMQRLLGVQRLLTLGVESLSEGNAMRTESALRTLAGARTFYAGTLRDFVAAWPPASDGTSLSGVIDDTLPLITALETHLQEKILPSAEPSPSIGAVTYDAKLSRRSFGFYRGASLAQDARQEMREIRELMVAEAARWRDSLGAPEHISALRGLSDADLLTAAIEAMEADRQSNSADFLESFRELTYASERFVEEQGIATIPRPTTLLIDLSPAHFSGAAVGGVYPSGPFAPGADTLFYVPSIPDSAPAAAREGFYRSFNTHFNTMILAHEMFPGHYLQYKVAVAQAPAVRSLFPNGPYVEGWGSFVEELMLNAGWAGNVPLTRLAHLRKRLENATRAYVSVQVHMNGWGEQQVIEFAREEGLLAPQFAINLWRRVVNSPLQITDYFTGYRQFRALYAQYQASAPEGGVRPWVDAVLRAGPLPPLALLDGELQRMLGDE